MANHHPQFTFLNRKLLALLAIAGHPFQALRSHRAVLRFSKEMTFEGELDNWPRIRHESSLKLAPDSINWQCIKGLEKALLGRLAAF